MAPNLSGGPSKRGPGLSSLLPAIPGARHCNLPLVGAPRSESSTGRSVQESPQNFRSNVHTSASSATGVKSAWSEREIVHSVSPGSVGNPQEDLHPNEVDPFLAKAQEIHALSMQMEMPNVVVTGMMFDLLGRISATMPSHKHLLDALLEHLECAVYSRAGAEQRQALNSCGDVEVMGTGKIPPEYLYRVPFFSVVRQQRKKIFALKKRMAMQQYIVEGSGSLKSAALTVLTRMQRMSNYTIRAWLFAFWMVFHTEQKQYRAKVEKFTLLQLSDLVQPFVHWRIMILMHSIERDLQMQRDMGLEQKMLAVEISHLTEHNAELRNELQSSEDAVTSLSKKLDEEQQAHSELQRRWATTRPELLKSTLCESLDLFFSFIVRAASLKEIEVKRRLMTKELGVLLLDDAETVQKVATMHCEHLLLRWVNHHVTQCKVTASELIDSASKERVNDTRSAWSTKDIECFRDRCKVVRNLQKIKDLDEDLKDSVVLTALYAMLKAAKFGQAALDPADLWPLDQRDLDQRAIALCSALRSIVPTRKAQCLLKPKDITKGNQEVMATFLAALFLDEAGLPEGDPDKQDSVAMTMNKKNKAGSPTVKTEKSRTSLDSEAPMSYVIATMEGEFSSAMIAYDPLQDPSRLLVGGEQLPDLMQIDPMQLLLRWVNLQLKHVYDKQVENFAADLQNGIALFLVLNEIAKDVLPSMNGASDVTERIRLIVEYGSRCTDFDVLTEDALTQGHADILAAFLASLFLNRPHLEIEEESQLSDHVELLEGVVRSGYAALAIEGPTGPPSSELTEFCAELEQKNTGIEAALKAVHTAREVMSIVEERMRAFLGDILAQRARGNPRSMVIAKEARDFLRHTALNPERIRVLLQKEESGKGDNSEESKESSKVRQSDLMLQVEDLLRKHFSLFREMYKYYSTSLGPAGGTGITVESVMRIYQDCKLRSAKFPPHMVETIFRDTLSAVVDSGKEKDKEKSKEKSDSEHDNAEKQKDTEDDSDDKKGQEKKDEDEKPLEKEQSKGLPPEGFVEVLLHIAARRYKEDGPLPEQLINLIQKNLKPYACRESENFFHKMAYDPEVRSVLRTFTDDLAVVFEVYSALDTEDEGAENLHTMNMKEFHLMLSHCELLDDFFDEAAVNTIFENIQQEEDTGEGEDGGDEDAEDFENNAMEVEAENNEAEGEGGAGPRNFRLAHQHSSILGEPGAQVAGVGDDNELSYSEFIDGLVAIVMYKDPNPFVPFHDRVNSFLKDSFFKALHRHWMDANPDDGSIVKTTLMPRLTAMYEQEAEPEDKKDKKEAAKDKGGVGGGGEPVSPKKDRPTINKKDFQSSSGNKQSDDV